MTRSSNIEAPGSLPALVRLVADRALNQSSHKTRICFFLGAGADISSGGISFAELKREAVAKYLDRELFDLTPSKEIDSKFEELFTSLPPDERSLLVEIAFQRMEPLRPSDAYKLLVLLAEMGGVDSIVTTNFDVMLERAQKELGRDLFQVFAPGLARPYLIESERFDLPKKPYLKLHGDIGSRSVVLLTTSELETSTYDSSMLNLLESILSSHDVVFVGYSGSDSALATIISRAVSAKPNRVFWCSPRLPAPNSPLVSELSDRIRFIRIGFDDLMMQVARPVLERPSLTATEPTYLRCLFDWRVEYCNREYLQAYGERSGHSIVGLFARRRDIENRLTSFLSSKRPLAIITGPSGFGKTTLGIRLYKHWGATASNRIFLIRSRSLVDSGDLEQYIFQQLGGLGSPQSFSLFKLERWLKENGLRLILYVDGINEFSADLDRCVHFFRSILRFSYFLPEDESAIKVIATIRQETWNAMLASLDTVQLRQTVWSETSHDLSTIACNELTDEELKDALTRLRDQGYASINIAELPVSVAEQLRDPYLLGVIADAVHEGLPAIPGARIYQQVFNEKLRRRGSFIDTTTINDTLASLALKCLARGADTFREIDIEVAEMRGDVIRLMKDLRVFVDADQGLLRFDHDRTYEYFLALGLATIGEPSLETIDDLRLFLRTFKTQSKAIAAARLFFLLAPTQRFGTLAMALRLLDRKDDRFDFDDRVLLFSFARDTLFEMCEQGEPLAETYLADAFAASREGDVGPHQLRALVQSAATFSSDKAIPLLSKVTGDAPTIAQTEASIYAIDKLAKEFLLMGCAVDLLSMNPFASFFADSSLSPWDQLTRLLQFAGQIGPDNTHPEELQSVKSTLSAAVSNVTAQDWQQSVDPVELTQSFLKNCDRLLFNATAAGINSFFENPNRWELKSLVQKLSDGNALGEEDLPIFERYTRSLENDIEYHLSHLLFFISSSHDLQATLDFTERRFESFCRETSPIEIDFYQAVLIYLHILHDLPYEQRRFGKWEEQIVREWPEIFLFRPGITRGESRGFHDSFDQIFEDGFGVIYPYGMLLPGIERRQRRYPEYQRYIRNEMRNPLPMYSNFLRKFLRENQIDNAIQLLQTLSGVIVLWPAEGLETLREAISSTDPIVRRATMRILSEAYNRHPEHTLQFLKASGAVISDEDLLEIKIRQDPRIGRRQVGEEEWARIAHFLLDSPRARAVLVACLIALLEAQSLTDATADILRIIGASNGPVEVAVQV